MVPETRVILSELRSIILTTLPEATEKVTLARRSLNFSHPDVGYFCRLRPDDGQVTFELEFGVLLPDPDGILIGNSCAKQVRYARFRSTAALPRTGIRRLLRAAVSLPPERATRLALVRSGAMLVVPAPRRRKRRRAGAA
jgi:hypothetical protein